jgi:hypothetical protein
MPAKFSKLQAWVNEILAHESKSDRYQQAVMKGVRFMKFTRKGAVAPIFALLSLTLLAGCGGGQNTVLPSASVTTNSIYAYMQAVQDESGNITTTVQLRDGPTNTARYLYLSSGDVLYTSLDIPPQQYLNFSGNLFDNSLKLSDHLKVASVRDLYTDYFLFNKVLTGKPEYFSVDTPSASSSLPVRAYVDFERSGKLTGPSSIDLPPAYQIVAPASNASFSRAFPLTLSWTNVDPTTTMRLNAAYVCLDGSRDHLSKILGTDTGSATLSSSDYSPATGVNCQVALILQRVLTGGVSTQFAFGSFEGIQQRTVQFTSIP